MRSVERGNNVSWDQWEGRRSSIKSLGMRNGLHEIDGRGNVGQVRGEIDSHEIMISMERGGGEGRLQEINQDGGSKKYMTSVERENDFHKTSVWGMGSMRSQWGEEYPGSMRSIDRGNELYKIRWRGKWAPWDQWRWDQWGLLYYTPAHRCLPAMTMRPAGKCNRTGRQIEDVPNW